MPPHPPKKTPHPPRKDGRKSMLVYLPTTVIEDLKVAAIRDGKHAYQLTEEAVRSYLAERRAGRRAKP
jgi:hypothetical protein